MEITESGDMLAIPVLTSTYNTALSVFLQVVGRLLNTRKTSVFSRLLYANITNLWLLLASSNDRVYQYRFAVIKASFVVHKYARIAHKK